MANALKIDTLELADELEAAQGDPRQTARVIGKTIGRIDISELATKTDIAEVRAEITEVKNELKQEITEVRAEITEARNELKQDLTKIDAHLFWIKGFGGLILGILVAPWLLEQGTRFLN